MLDAMIMSSAYEAFIRNTSPSMEVWCEQFNECIFMVQDVVVLVVALLP